MVNEQKTFSEIERLSKIALEAGDLVKLQNMLLPLLREDDRSRSVSENLFIYRTLGTIYEEQGQHAESLIAYEQAHGYDARDFETLNTLVDAELKKDVTAQDEHKMLELMIFHREMLKPALVTRIFKAMGDARREKGELSQAREFYEKALDVRPGDMDLINAIIQVSEASGDEDAIKAAREKLLDMMTAPESRAAVLVSIGDDYLNRLKDEQKALLLYEEALSECRQSSAALGRVLVIAERAGDWDRALHALKSLIKYSDDEDDKCKFLLKQAWIFKEKLDTPRKAIDIFNDVLDIRPSQIEVFQGIISMLQAQKDFMAIEANFERMIERQRHVTPLNVKLMAVLCKNLGELRLKQLNNIRGAAQAYKIVSELYPDNVNFHVILAKLYAMNDDQLADAVHENREILRLAPDKLDAVTDLAKCYRRMQQFDASLCIYRVLNVLGMGDDEGRAIVAQFAEQDMPTIDTRLTGEHWKLIYPNTLDKNLARILHIVSPIIGDAFSNDLDTYGINKNAEVNLDNNSLFANILKSETSALGFAEVPHVFQCDAMRGVNNAYLSTRSFLVNSNFLSNRSARDIAFTSAKALLLIRPDFYLLPLGVQVIEKVILTVFKTICPQLNIELDKNMAKVSRLLDRNITATDRATLTELIFDFQRKGEQLNIRLFMESVEDFANRVGLLFCDDPAIIESLLNEEDAKRKISSRSARDRIGSLLVWGLSEDYLKLRKMLGIALSA